MNLFQVNNNVIALSWNDLTVAIYCCVQTSRLHRLADMHMWYKEDRKEALARRAWGEGHSAKAAGAFFG
jgi:hypothetical protein